jgi:hypothetical protein
MKIIHRRTTIGAAIALAALGVAAQASVVQGAVPVETQRAVYQHVCESAAGGTLSDQVALVCTHTGTPQWEEAKLGLLERVCEHALGGTFEYRSQFPTEFAACFFE